MFLPIPFLPSLAVHQAIPFLAFFVLSLMVSTSMAEGIDRYGEREVLTRIVKELAHIDSMLKEAEAKADPDARIRLQYTPLRRDLMVIRHGIDTHLMTPDQQPRSFKPISGDYRR